MKNKISLFSSFLFMLFLFIFSIIPQGKHPVGISWFDKIAHFVAFLLLYYTIVEGMGKKRSQALIFSLVLGLVTEGVQLFLPWREGSLYDLTADISGIILGFLFMHKSFKDKFSIAVSTMFPVGYVKYGPGTLAALLTSAFIYFLKFNVFLIVEIAVLILFTGIISSGKSAVLLENNDPAQVVIDEAAGMLFALVFHNTGVLQVLFAFFFFRIYDIVKPLGIRKMEKLPGGIGIMMDDVIAGVYANLSVFIVFFLFRYIKGGM